MMPRIYGMLFKTSVQWYGYINMPELLDLDTYLAYISNAFGRARYHLLECDMPEYDLKAILNLQCELMCALCEVLLKNADAVQKRFRVGFLTVRSNLA